MTRQPDTGAERVIEKTADNSLTIYLPEFGEHYHSVKGAIAESSHVYINLGWRHVAKTGSGVINVAEAGFGTGLNAVLTAMAARDESRPTLYTTLELYPLDPDLVGRYISALDPATVDTGLLRLIHSAPWGHPVELTPTFTICKLKTDMTLADAFPAGSDVVYYDAFAPDVQPHLWTAQQLERVAAALAPGGALVTYCAKGVVRRALAGAGLNVERLPGPPAGKREILRACKP